MADESLFQSISYWNIWGKSSFPRGIIRQATNRLIPWLDHSQVLAISGMRRAGKSTVMRQLVHHLVKQGVPAKDTLFINLEDPAFLEHQLDPSLLDRVVDSYTELARPSGIPHLFLDEIHNVTGWGNWARARVETGRAKIVISGSTSQLLESDLATALTGRNITETLWPTSFREFLRFRDLQWQDEMSLLAQGERVRQELVQYLRYGGLPEVVLAADDHLRSLLLKQYFRDLLYRDVVRRHAVRDVGALERIAQHYLTNTANLSTYNRIKDLYGLAMDQVRSYTRYLEECYLIRQLPRFSTKLSTQARSPRKIYATDVGLRNAVCFRFSQDIGRLAETLVFNHLALDPEVQLFYFADKGECDFLVWRGDQPRAAIQVSYDPSDTLPPREISSLLEAMTAAGLEQGLIITHGLSFERTEQGKAIRAEPLWRWLSLSSAF